MFDIRPDILENLRFVLDYDDFKASLKTITSQMLEHVKAEMQKTARNRIN